jgi:hypothetical protein
MKTNVIGLFQKKMPQTKREASKSTREEPHLRVAIPPEASAKLNQFLQEKGLPEMLGVPLLIEYGLPNESEKELGELRLEMQEQMGSLWGKYATTKFEAHELSMENTRIAMKLNLMLSENRVLKKRLTEEGLQVPNDEWDNWDSSATMKYYRRYVLNK